MEAGKTDRQERLGSGMNLTVVEETDCERERKEIGLEVDKQGREGGREERCRER